MKIEHCTLCPRKCGVVREETSGSGYCGMGANPVVARAALHFWEEPCISGKRGSGTVFFTGCSLKCVFCQNYQISTEREVGQSVSTKELAGIFDRLVSQGAHNINLVNPTHFASAIAEALKLRKLPVPVVYNSGGYENLETLQMLDGLIDIYLPDLKYADNALAQKYSGAPNYVEKAKAAVLEMARQTGPAQFDADGMMTRGTIVRHLICRAIRATPSRYLTGWEKICPKVFLSALWRNMFRAGGRRIFRKLTAVSPSANTGKCRSICLNWTWTDLCRTENPPAKVLFRYLI